MHGEMKQRSYFFQCLWTAPLNGIFAASSHHQSVHYELPDGRPYLCLEKKKKYKGWEPSTVHKKATMKDDISSTTLYGNGLWQNRFRYRVIIIEHANKWLFYNYFTQPEIHNDFFVCIKFLFTMTSRCIHTSIKYYV